MSETYSAASAPCLLWHWTGRLLQWTLQEERKTTFKTAAEIENRLVQINVVCLRKKTEASTITTTKKNCILIARRVRPPESKNKRKSDGASAYWRSNKCISSDCCILTLQSVIYVAVGSRLMNDLCWRHICAFSTDNRQVVEMEKRPTASLNDFADTFSDCWMLTGHLGTDGTLVKTLWPVI